MIDLLADLILGGLLVLTSGWCALLYRRLQRLRVERSDIETFMVAVDSAVRRAELAIAGIRDGACEAQRRLEAEQHALDQRISELTRLIESAGRMARRVENAVHQGARAMAEEAIQRDRPRQAPQEPQTGTRGEAPEAGASASSGGSPRPRLETELARLLERLR